MTPRDARTHINRLCLMRRIAVAEACSRLRIVASLDTQIATARPHLDPDGHAALQQEIARDETHLAEAHVAIITAP
jgi:hypothetical protein